MPRAEARFVERNIDPLTFEAFAWIARDPELTTRNPTKVRVAPLLTSPLPMEEVPSLAMEAVPSRGSSLTQPVAPTAKQLDYADGDGTRFHLRRRRWKRFHLRRR